VDCPVGFGFRFLGHHAPSRAVIEEPGESDLLTFEEMAKRGRGLDQELSYDRLGVLRLDVDDLGAIFASGLGAQTDFVRVASLSREMQLYFAGYLNELARQHDMYVVYSGGDDAFLVGSWYNTLHFTEALRRSFARFTVGNPAVSFSAGLFVCSPFYPVARFYREAGRLEEQAKDFGRPDTDPTAATKNAIAVFDHVYDWPRFAEMFAKAEELNGLVLRQGETKDPKESGRFRRSLILRLLRYISANRDRDQSDAFERYRSVAQLHYLLARHKIEGSSLVGDFVRDSSHDEGQAALDYLLPFTYVYHLSKKR
jgi:CRISPR-associated protein Csm1